MPSEVDRTVGIVARDVSFDTSALHFRVGETVRFVIVNKGSLVHGFALGNAAVQKAHRREMAQMIAR